MITTILIVAKNEAGGIRKVIRSVKPYADEVIVVDGHSTDGTAGLAKQEGVKVLRDHGLGRGDGVRVGLAAAKEGIIVLFDADGSHNAKDIPRLVSPIKHNKADVVLASRRTGGTLDTNPGFSGVLRSFGADLMAYLINVRFQTDLTDILYSFRAMRKTIVQRLKLTANDFSIEQEMVVTALKHNLRITEIPSRECARQWGTSKLSTITGLRLLLVLLYQLFLTFF